MTPQPDREVEAIFWDNDGVLVETEHLYFEATRDVLRSIGLDLTEQQYIELFLVESRGAWHFARERGFSEPEIARFVERRNALYAERLAAGPALVPGITAVLDALHGRYVMGIVTSSRPEHFALIHQATGLLRYFDFVLASGDYARSKPEPDPYLRAIERSGVDREACIAIEDSERGLEAATRAGIRCLVVPSGLTRGRAFAGAYRVLATVADVPAALAPAPRTPVR